MLRKGLSPGTISCRRGGGNTEGVTIQELLEGFRRFRRGYFRSHRRLFAELAREGQSPPAMVISCCDSRVDPARIFDAGPGDMFVTRNVANLVPPYAPDSDYHGTSAAIEFAVKALKVRAIVVMGHASCGGVRALLDEAPAAGEFVTPWMGIAEPARQAAMAAAPPGPERQRHCELEVVKVSLDNLRTFPWVAAAEAAGSLALHGAYFDVASGSLWWLAAGDSEFRKAG